MCAKVHGRRRRRRGIPQKRVNMTVAQGLKKRNLKWEETSRIIKERKSADELMQIVHQKDNVLRQTEI